MSRRHGFTLTELVTVTGVIVILASIVLPILQRAYQAGARARCQANLHSLTTATFSYAADNAGQLPFPNWCGTVNDATTYGYGWLFACPQCRTDFPADLAVNGTWSTSLAPANGAKTGVLWQYTNTLCVYRCPIDDPTQFFGTEAMTAYLMNGAICAFGRLHGGTTGEPSYNLRAFTKPEISALFWEPLEQRYKGQQLTGASWNDGSSYPSEEILSDRHEKGASVSFLDGHIEWVSKDTWVTWVNQSPGPLWCTPNSGTGH